MKKLTLDQAWVLCIQQWKWICKEIKDNSTESVENLKIQWCEDHKFGSVSCSCFFCEYDDQRQPYGNSPSCSFCPGKKIDKDFHCESKDCNFTYDPIKFYKKISSLKRKRMKQKAKKAV